MDSTNDPMGASYRMLCQSTSPHRALSFSGNFPSIRSLAISSSKNNGSCPTRPQNNKYYFFWPAYISPWGPSAKLWTYMWSNHSLSVYFSTGQIYCYWPVRSIFQSAKHLMVKDQDHSTYLSRKNSNSGTLICKSGKLKVPPCPSYNHHTWLQISGYL